MHSVTFSLMKYHTQARNDFYILLVRPIVVVRLTVRSLKEYPLHINIINIQVKAVVVQDY